MDMRLVTSTAVSMASSGLHTTVKMGGETRLLNDVTGPATIGVDSSGCRNSASDVGPWLKFYQESSYTPGVTLMWNFSAAL